jgi:hypothetical protein
MRQVINNCSTGQDFPLWLRSGAQMVPAITTTASTSLPGSYSLQRRTFNFQQTPDLGHRQQPLKHFQSLQQQQQFILEPRSPDSPPVPLAAPPYQRLGGSLPPIIGNNINEEGEGKGQMTIGTLQVRILNFLIFNSIYFSKYQLSMNIQIIDLLFFNNNKKKIIIII